jgi:serine phosphatase RsbU (regulator of sigma subunit)
MKLKLHFFILNLALNSSFLFSQQVEISKELPIIQKKYISENEQSFINKQLKEFHTAKNDTLKIKAILSIIDNSYNEFVWPKYNDFLLSYIRQIDKRKVDPKTKYFLDAKYAECLNNKGYWYGEIGKIEKQIYYYEKSLEICLKINDLYGVGNAYNNIGYVHDKRGTISLALDYYLKSLKIKEEIKDSIGIANTYINLGFNYLKVDDYKNALAFFTKSYEIREKIKDFNGLANSCNQIASVHQKLGRNELDENKRNLHLTKSYELFNKALELNQQVDNLSGVAESYINIGSYFQQKNDLNQALSYYLKSLEIHNTIDDIRGKIETKNKIGNIFLIKGKLVEAEKFGKEAHEMAMSIGFPQDINESSKLLYHIYKKKSDAKNALFYFENHILMRDSIRNDDIKSKNLEMNINYEYQKNKSEDSIKNLQAQEIKDAQITAQKSQLKQKRTLNISLIGGLSLLFILSYVIFSKYKNSQKQNAIINQQKSEVEAQKVLIEDQHYLLEEKNKEITDSIKYAERIQGAILTPDLKWNSILPQSFVLNKPKDILSGDFYWIADTETHIFVAAADCTGHGVPGALISIVNFNLLNKAVLERGIRSTSEILDAVNVWLTESLNQTKEHSTIKDGMDISLISINKQNGQIAFTGANNPLYLFSGDEMIEIKGDKFPVGAFIDEEIRHFTTQEINPKFGDTIYLFSDGFADQFGGPNEKKYKYKTFKELLFRAKELPIIEQKEFLYQEFRAWQGKIEQTDDVLVIGIKI